MPPGQNTKPLSMQLNFSTRTKNPMWKASPDRMEPRFCNSPTMRSSVIFRSHFFPHPILPEYYDEKKTHRRYIHFCRRISIRSPHVQALSVVSYRAFYLWIKQFVCHLLSSWQQRHCQYQVFVCVECGWKWDRDTTLRRQQSVSKFSNSFASAERKKKTKRKMTETHPNKESRRQKNKETFIINFWYLRWPLTTYIIITACAEHKFTGSTISCVSCQHQRTPEWRGSEWSRRFHCNILMQQQK